MEQVRWARDLARELLAEALPTRWLHTQGVGRTAQSIAHIAGGDASLLACAAWLHDIGYSPALVETGFHPLDGARYLRDVENANDRLCRLVANHSYAIVEGRNRGLSSQLIEEFPAIDGIVADALTYCDMTVSPEGNRINIEMRLAEALNRYGLGSVVAKSLTEARPQLTKATDVVTKTLASRTGRKSEP